EADHETFRKELQGDDHERAATVKTEDRMAHKPLEFLDARSTAHIDDRRGNPRHDVMTELATATFPDGSLPDVHDVMLIASNLFAAGQETTARMLSTALRLIGERPELGDALRSNAALVPIFVEEIVRLESPIQ